jgi:hypothetical protein
MRQSACQLSRQVLAFANARGEFPAGSGNCRNIAGAISWRVHITEESSTHRTGIVALRRADWTQASLAGMVVEWQARGGSLACHSPIFTRPAIATDVWQLTKLWAANLRTPAYWRIPRSRVPERKTAQRVLPSTSTRSAIRCSSRW